MIELFVGYILTNGQQELLKMLNQFLEDKTSCFLLKGYAGTGKTFMMKGLTDYLKSINRPFVLAAPTGRAAKVISQRTKSKAYTIHKTIYSNQDIKEYKTESEDGTETFKFYYNLKNNEDQANTVYIIDESSMLSDMYSEGEFFRFGSGFLLQDLLKYINFDNNDHKKKLIFIGDNAQLPPVNMNFSPALNEQYLIEKCQITVSNYELTEVVRQQKDSGILKNATQIRASLKTNTFNQIDIETNFSDIIPIQHQDLLPSYLNACGNQIDDDTIIIAYSNSSVKEYNDFVRNHFFPNQSTITEGDKIILVNNNYNYQIELLNGDFGIIKEVSQTNEKRNITLKRKNKAGNVVEIKVPLQFRNVTIQFKDADEKPYDISCKIIENILYSKERDLSSDELKALYLDFKIRNPNLKVGTKELKDALRTDKYFNALRVKFGYAITCHKSQGGEWKRAFVNCKTAMGYFNASYFRWLYTALTRAKEVLYTLDEPHFQIGTINEPITNFTQRQDLIVLKPEILDTDLAFDFIEGQENLRPIFYTIFDLIKDEGIAISRIEHKPYHEIYYFEKENETVRLKINYKKEFKISTIQNITDNSLTKLLMEKVKIIENKLVIIDEKCEDIEINQRELTFPEDKPFLKLFFEQLKTKVNNQNIEIVDIEHKPYHEIYKFQKGNFVAFYKFWYDGQGRFKNTEIIVNKTTGLIPDINSLLNQKY
jgi:hypothetical protein